MKWEYTFYQADYLSSWAPEQRLENNLYKNTANGRMPAMVIQEYGREGWELVSVISINGGTGGYTEALLFTFKRPLVN